VRIVTSARSWARAAAERTVERDMLRKKKEEEEEEGEKENGFEVRRVSRDEEKIISGRPAVLTINTVPLFIYHRRNPS